MANRQTPEDYFKPQQPRIETQIPPPEHKIDAPPVINNYYYYTNPQQQSIPSTALDPTTMLILGITAAIAIVGIIALMRKDSSR